MTIVIGFTGNIGSGKSTISHLMAELGAVVLSADEIGHEALEPHTETWQEVVNIFGQEILKAGDEVDRQKLGEIVFNDAEALAKLNQVMHRRMYRMAEERIEKLKQQGTKVIVLEAALLIEAGWLPLVEQVWVTVASEDAALPRLRQRSGLSKAQVMARLRSQLPQEEKIKYADVVINNDVPLSEVKTQVKELWERLTSEMGEKKLCQD
jgi:dephospho-CoA kinase